MQRADGQFGGLPPQLIWHQVSDMAGLTALHDVGSPSAGNPEMSVFISSLCSRCHSGRTSSPPLGFC